MKKKDLERAYLAQFAELYDGFPEGEIRSFELPDFLIQTKDRILGIEVTRLFHEPGSGESPPKEQDSLRRMVLNRAKDIYDARSHSPVHVTVSFVFGARLRLPNVEILAHKLAALGEKLYPEEGKSKREEFGWDNRSYFPEQIASVSVLRFPGGTNSFWGGSGAAFIPDLSVTQIKTVISEKDLRVESYLNACSEIWLLLCCSGGRASVSPKKRALRFTGAGFTGVFWFSCRGGVHELKTAPRAS